MFTEACSKAAAYTRHAIISWQTAEGTCKAAIAAFVVVNQEGWIVSAAHLANTLHKQQADAAAITAYDAKYASRPAPTKRSKGRQPTKVEQELIRRAGAVWGENGVTLPSADLVRGADILVAKIDNPALLNVTSYPTFKRAAGIRQGMALVRLGYPFIDVDCKFNEVANRFENAPTDTSLFAIEGILSRQLSFPIAGSRFPVVILETSSPGLMGQSGGPILDKDGSVCAIQSSTQHYNLGFNLKEKSGATIPQFLNVGRGISSATLEHIFAERSISANWVD